MHSHKLRLSLKYQDNKPRNIDPKVYVIVSINSVRFSEYSGPCLSYTISVTSFRGLVRQKCFLSIMSTHLQ